MKIMTVPKNGKVKVKEGGTTNLVCNAKAVTPAPAIIWWYSRSGPSEIIRRTPVGSGEVLTLRNISRDMNGSYECVASNNVHYPSIRLFEVQVEYDMNETSQAGSCKSKNCTEDNKMCAKMPGKGQCRKTKMSPHYQFLMDLRAKLDCMDRAEAMKIRKSITNLMLQGQEE